LSELLSALYADDYRRFRFAIVVTNGGGDKITLAAAESGDIAIKSEVFTVLVMAFVADGVANVVKSEADSRSTRDSAEDDGPAEADRKAGD